MALVFLLLLAGPGWAQPAYAPEVPRAETPPAADEPPPMAARLGAEVGMAAVTSLGLGLAAGLVGGAAGYAVCAADNHGSSTLGYCTLGAAGVGGALGAGVGVPLGVWWGGRLTEGRGSFWGAFGGFSLGMALGGGALLLEQFDIGRGLLLASPLLAVVGYELSHANTPPEAPPAVGISPTLGLGPGGGSLGFQGRF